MRSVSASLAPREWAVICFGSLTLVLSAWVLGGMRLFGLHVLLIGATLTFLAAVLPLPAKWNGLDGAHGNKQNLIRLLKFPFFWISLLFLAYITTQGLNHDTVQEQNTSFSWMKTVEPIVAWLPTGVGQLEYSEMSAFRVLANFSAAYLLVWGLWVGVSRRKSVLILFWSLALSGLGMALVGILQKFSGTKKILWFIDSPNPSFWGTYIYRNQGVAYLCLILTACGVLYFYHLGRSERRGASGGPHFLLFIFVGLIMSSIGLALSRGGILFGSILTLSFLVLAVLRGLFARSGLHSMKVSLVAFALLGVGVFSAFSLIDLGAIEKRFGDISKTIETADEDSRMIVSGITWEMAQEELIYGAGAGSWRYIFPEYQFEHPEIYYVRYHRKKGWFGRRIYQFAHNDILQFLFEYGIVGCSILIAGIAYWFGIIFWRSADNSLSAIFLCIGFVLALGHAVVDFIFQSPSYWLVLNVLFCLTAKLLTLHYERHYGSR